MNNPPRDASVLAAAIVYNVADAAAMIGVGKSLMYELIAQGRIPVVRFGKRIVIRLMRWSRRWKRRNASR